MQPITQALSSIHSESYTSENASVGLLEIDDLFDLLAGKDKAHDDEVRRLDREKQEAQKQYEQAQTQVSRLTDHRKKEIDPDAYALFLTGISRLTKTQREIFSLYLDGKKGKEIIELRSFSINALKYHNKEIYGKLGVSSLKELLMYAALMKQDEERNGKG
ncbi:hypothetical protein SDC9_163773 [bioreactor metagenome]|uniref:HTH luxR-type domain-containing protein n=1 Tax=bioreactor metagenome TaxID=1076179 RepID=A0A645FWY8_9ZZZZ